MSYMNNDGTLRNDRSMKAYLEPEEVRATDADDMVTLDHLNDAVECMTLLNALAQHDGQTTVHSVTVSRSCHGITIRTRSTTSRFISIR